MNEKFSRRTELDSIDKRALQWLAACRTANSKSADLMIKKLRKEHPDLGPADFIAQLEDMGKKISAAEKIMWAGADGVRVLELSDITSANTATYSNGKPVPDSHRDLMEQWVSKMKGRLDNVKRVPAAAEAIAEAARDLFNFFKRNGERRREKFGPGYTSAEDLVIDFIHHTLDAHGTAAIHPSETMSRVMYVVHDGMTSTFGGNDYWLKYVLEDEGEWSDFQKLKKSLQDTEATLLKQAGIQEDNERV